MVNFPPVPRLYGSMLMPRFHRDAPLCWSCDLEDHARAAVVAPPHHWAESTLRNYPRTYSEYIHLRWCAHRHLTSGGTHLLRHVTSRVSCQTWTQCHGSPVLAQVDAQA